MDVRLRILGICAALAVSAFILLFADLFSIRILLSESPVKRFNELFVLLPVGQYRKVGYDLFLFSFVPYPFIMQKPVPTYSILSGPNFIMPPFEKRDPGMPSSIVSTSTSWLFSTVIIDIRFQTWPSCIYV